MILIELEEKNSKPKYQQIIDQVRQKVENRILKPGEKLPSTRELAEKVGIHRTTVSMAYQELWALGYVDLHPGRRPQIRDRMKVATYSNRTEKGLIDWNATASTATNSIWQTYRSFHPETNQNNSASFINFSRLEMDNRLLPLENFRTCLNRIIRKQGISLLGYGDRAGFNPLRNYIARRLQSHCISVSPDEILLTNGSQQAIDLIFRLIASPDKTVAIEAPTYAQVIPLLKFYGLKPLEIPILQGGMDLSFLEEACLKNKPVLLYTMPNFQNPTGISTSQSHRERLLSICETHRLPILEDGFEEEMKYFGKVVLPIKSMDKHQLVIYCGTFSKVLFPGVRIGWIAAEKECIERLLAIRRFSELSLSMILQAAMYEFCQSGYYDLHITKMHRIFRKRMQTAIYYLCQYISPAWADWIEPTGGYLIWLKLKPTLMSVDDLKPIFSRFGVQVAFGNYFFYSETKDVYLRLSISTLNEEEIANGLKRLGNALGQIYTRK